MSSRTPESSELLYGLEEGSTRGGEGGGYWRAGVASEGMGKGGFDRGGVGGGSSDTGEREVV
jgi:hypothetical protein